MNDELMQMAREAGFELDCCSLEWVARIERFAQLVAKAERQRFYGLDKPEECSKGCPPKQVCDYCQLVEPAREYARAAVEAERKACAEKAKEIVERRLRNGSDVYGTADAVLQAISARR